MLEPKQNVEYNEIKRCNFMKEAFSEEDIKQAFFDLAAKMQKQCGNWQSLPETDRDRVLKERIINKGKELLVKRS